MEKQLYREDDEIQREDALARRYHLLSDGGLLSQDLLQQFLPIFDAIKAGRQRCKVVWQLEENSTADVFARRHLLQEDSVQRYIGSNVH